MSALQQPQGVKGPRQAASAPLGKPPRPASITQFDEAKQPTQQKPKVPVLEKHRVDQLSTEEQSSLTSKFKEATDAEKKVIILNFKFRWFSSFKLANLVPGSVETFGFFEAVNVQ